MSNYRGHLTECQKEVVCRLYREGKSAYELAALFGCSEMPIYACLKMAGITRRDRSACQRKFSLNEGYFSSIETERQAYWLGFLAADGYACPQRNSVIVNLSSKDADHLESFRRDTECENPLYHYLANGHPTSRLALVSVNLLRDVEKFGIIPGKTTKLTWHFISWRLQPHYLRGYFDGDGMFRSQAGNRPRKDGVCPPNAAIKIVSTEAFAKAAHEYLKIELPEIGGHTVAAKNSKTAWKLQFHGNAQCLPIVNLLYEGATIYLPRKRQRVLDHYLALPKYRDQLRFG